MTIFISGKVSGDPDYAMKFERARWDVLPYADAVISPAFLPEKGFTHAAYMRMAAAMLAECGGVYFLPDWQESDGARQEMQLAKKLGKKVFFSIEEVQRS